MRRNRRKEARATIQMLVQFQVENYEAFLRDYATDLSVGGMFIRTNQPRNKGERILLHFTSEAGDSIIEAFGQVVHVSPEGMGIEFIKVDDASRKRIERIIRQKMREIS